MLAVKVLEVPSNLIAKDDDELKDMLIQLKEEINTLRAVNHPNIVRLFDVKKREKPNSPNYNIFYIFMEYCNQGNLRKFIEKNDLSENEIIYYFS